MSESSGSEQSAGRMLGAASLLSASSVLSRILGLVRNQVVAYFYGTGLEADAFHAGLCNVAHHPLEGKPVDPQVGGFRRPSVGSPLRGRWCRCC